MTKHSNLRNFVCIGNDDCFRIDIDDIYGKHKGPYIGVEYVWFKIKNKQLLCTKNEYKSNYELIKNSMNENSDEYEFLNAESIDLQNSIYIKTYHKFLSDMTPPVTSKVVSYTSPCI